MLRSFEDFVNRPANNKIVYDQAKKMARSENSHVRLALYFHWNRFSAFGCHYKFPPTSPLIFLLNKGSERSRKAKSPRCKSFQHAFSNSSVGSFMSPLVELTKTISHPAVDIFIQQRWYVRKAKSPRCKSFLHEFSNSSVRYFMSPENYQRRINARPTV